MSHLNQNPVIYSVEEIKQLVQKAKSGDHASFTKLYNAFFTPVYRYVFSRIHDKDTSDDIVQTVFIRWYNALPSYELKVSPLQYLFVIARRLLIDEYGKIQTISFDEDFDEIIDETHSIEEELDIKITTEHILSQFKNLSETHQEVLRLHFFGELTTEEIARILEKKEPAIRQIKHRALIALRELTKNINENN